jgi:hypothetical protein
MRQSIDPAPYQARRGGVKIKVVCFSNQFDTTFACDPRQPADLEVGPGGG